MNTTTAICRFVPFIGLTLLSVLSFQLSSAFAQGNLTPPGAPAPTMKSLDQLDAKLEKRALISSLPFTISAPGSYFVTSNLTGVASQHGVTINADDVTLDLNGFELVGPGSGVTSGIRLINAHVNARIHNGTVRGWLSGGVVAETSACTEMHVENLRVFGSGLAGIALGNNGTAKGCEVRTNTTVGISGGAQCQVTGCTSTGNGSDGINLGMNAVVTDCIATGNGSIGISFAQSSTVKGCIASGNTDNGINIGSECVVSDCSANSNGGTGFGGPSLINLVNCVAYRNTVNGFWLDSGCALQNCSAEGNIASGFLLADTAALNNCAANGNTNIGISVGSGSSISHCTAEANKGTSGILAGSACTIFGCALRANSSSASVSAGITAGSECHISQCVVSSTSSTAATTNSGTGMGINTGNSCTVQNCTVQGCRGDGIRVSSQSVVVGNTCDGNGFSTGDGAGIHTTSIENRIEANNVTTNDRGIDVNSIRSLIIRNSAAGNTTNYVIAASNRYGPIVDITAAGAAAVTGSSAVSSLASTDPGANFSY